MTHSLVWEQLSLSLRNSLPFNTDASCIFFLLEFSVNTKPLCRNMTCLAVSQIITTQGRCWYLARHNPPAWPAAETQSWRLGHWDHPVHCSEKEPSNSREAIPRFHSPQHSWEAAQHDTAAGLLGPTLEKDVDPREVTEAWTRRLAGSGLLYLCDSWKGKKPKTQTGNCCLKKKNKILMMLLKLITNLLLTICN